MMGYDIVNHLGNEYGLADTGAAKEARLAATLERAQHVDHLDAGFDDLRPGYLARQRHRRGMNRAPLCAFQLWLAIDGLAKDVEDASQDALANGDLQPVTERPHLIAAGEALRRRQANGA